jgi:hypothetical protein
MMPLAHAQYGGPAVNATQEQLEECKRLGIEPEQCSDTTILAKQRFFIGPNPPSPTFDGVVSSIANIRRSSICDNDRLSGGISNWNFCC